MYAHFIIRRQTLLTLTIKPPKKRRFVAVTLSSKTESDNQICYYTIFFFCSEMSCVWTFASDALKVSCSSQRIPWKKEERKENLLLHQLSFQSSIIQPVSFKRLRNGNNKSKGKRDCSRTRQGNQRSHAFKCDSDADGFAQLSIFLFQSPLSNFTRHRNRDGKSRTETARVGRWATSRRRTFHELKSSL